MVLVYLRTPGSASAPTSRLRCLALAFVLGLIGCEGLWQGALDTPIVAEQTEDGEERGGDDPLLRSDAKKSASNPDGATKSKLNDPPPPDDATATVGKTSPSFSAKDPCRDALVALNLVKLPEDIIGERVQAEVSETQVFSEPELSEWAKKAANQIAGQKSCRFKKLTFMAAGTQDQLLQGTIILSDQALHAAGKISTVEWARRFDIRALATVTSLKKKLTRARLNGDHKTALALLEEWLTAEPQGVAARLIKANILLEKGDTFEALLLYDDVLAGDPKNPTALFNKAFAKRQVGSFAESAAGYQQVLGGLASATPAPQVDAVLMHLAEAYLANQQLTEAGRALDRVNDPTVSDFVVLKSNLLRARKKPQEAVVLLEKLAKSKDAPDIVYYNLTLLHLDLKDEAAAKKSFDELRRLNPTLARELEFLQPFRPAGSSQAAGTMPALPAVSSGVSTGVVSAPSTGGPVPVNPQEDDGYGDADAEEEDENGTQF